MHGVQAWAAGVDDFELVARWREGDTSAREELFSRHYLRIHRFFGVKVPQAADDLTQQTFLKCIELVDKLEEPSSFRAFLFGVARNYLLRHLRASGRESARVQPYQTTPGERTTPSAIITRSAEQLLVLRAMEKVPTDLRIALELYYWEDMSAPDIAQVLRVPVSTITTRLSRARTRLGKAIEQLSRRSPMNEDEIVRWTRSLADRAAIDAPGRSDR